MPACAPVRLFADASKFARLASDDQFDGSVPEQHGRLDDCCMSGCNSCAIPMLQGSDMSSPLPHNLHLHPYVPLPRAPALLPVRLFDPSSRSTSPRMPAHAWGSCPTGQQAKDV